MAGALADGGAIAGSVTLVWEEAVWLRLGLLAWAARAKLRSAPRKARKSSKTRAPSRAAPKAATAATVTAGDGDDAEHAPVAAAAPAPAPAARATQLAAAEGAAAPGEAALLAVDVAGRLRTLRDAAVDGLAAIETAVKERLGQPLRDQVGMSPRPRSQMCARTRRTHAHTHASWRDKARKSVQLVSKFYI